MNITDVVSKVTGGARGAHGTMSKLMGIMGGEDNAGLNNLLSSLQSAGLTDQVKSWVGKGANLPVTGKQIASALGLDKLTKLSQETGLSTDEVADHLAEQLPPVVDHLTPEGQVP